MVFLRNRAIFTPDIDFIYAKCYNIFIFSGKKGFS